MADSKAKKQGQNLKETMSQSVQVNKYVQMILTQPDIILKELPNLPTHQQTARTHAEKWEGIWYGILSTTSEIIDFAGVFDSAYKELLKLTDRLEKGDENAKKEFNAVMKDVVIKSLNDKIKSSSEVASKVATFSDSFAPDYKSFQSDFKTADQLITKDDEKLKSLKSDLAAAKARALILEKSIGIDASLIPTTLSATYDAGPVGVIVGGILLAIEVGALVGMLVEYAETMKEVYSLQNKITDIKAELTQLHGIENQITGLENSSLGIKEGANSIHAGWEEIIADMERVIKDAEGITPQQLAEIIKLELKGMAADWEVVMTIARNLQPSGGAIPHKSFKTVNEMLDAITPKK